MGSVAENEAGGKPRRVQLKRTKGWRMPDNTVKVARPTKWGNPYKVRCEDMPGQGFVGWSVLTPQGAEIALYHTRKQANGRAVEVFKDWLMHSTKGRALVDEAKQKLAGHNLACFCSLDDPCHADIWLKIANEGE